MTWTCLENFKVNLKLQKQLWEILTKVKKLTDNQEINIHLKIQNSLYVISLFTMTELPFYTK